MSPSRPNKTSASGLASPVTAKYNTADGEDEKTAEERAEEKKKLD
jgi:hypothetical protein